LHKPHFHNTPNNTQHGSHFLARRTPGNCGFGTRQICHRHLRHRTADDRRSSPNGRRYPNSLHPDSPLLNTTDDTGLQKRSAIKVVIAGISAGAGVVVAGYSAVQLYDNIAAKIKAKSDRNSCTLVFGTDHTTATTRATLTRPRRQAAVAIPPLSRSPSRMQCAPALPDCTIREL
jgi:hypothetical protein